MKIHDAEAIVLHTLNYGESDRIVTLLTPGDGVCKAFARNARSSRKRFGCALEAYAQIRCLWSPPRHGELLDLKEAELLDLRPGLRRDLATLALAAYGGELVEAMGGQHDHRDLFALLTAFLDHLAAHGASAEARLLVELRLLFLSGYAPHLLHCSACNATLVAPQAAFDPRRGGSLCLDCADAGGERIALGTVGTLSRISRTPPTNFDGFRLSPQTVNESRRILDTTLPLHLTRPLKSLAFLQQVGRIA